jgi:uncharacterized membrane protein
MAMPTMHHRAENGNTERLAKGLGWFSHGLGVAQIAAPRQVARLIGVDDGGDNRTLLRAVGAREITSGIGILSRPRPTGWLWARVGGDMMDLALLAAALRSNKSRRTRVAGATAAIVGVTALDVICSTRLTSGRSTSANGTGHSHSGVHVERAITINRPAEEVYTAWRQFENLPRFMNHLESVQVTGERQSYWKAKGPAGRTVEWDAEITEDRPNELIAWRSLPGASVQNSGSVRFDPAPGGNATEVRVKLDYTPPGGDLGTTVARFFGEEPAQQLREDLLRFKQVLELGEVVHSDSSVYGDRRLHPAQPPDHAIAR